MSEKSPSVPSGKPAALNGRYNYVTSVKAGRRTLSWLAVDRETKRVIVAAPIGKARLSSLERVIDLDPGHLAPIRALLHAPKPNELPGELAQTKPVGVAVADYVPGETLHARLKLRTMPAVDLVNIVLQVGRAAAAMHRAGTPHGSISPRSVVIAPKGNTSAPVLSQLIAPTSGSFSSVERLKTRSPSVEDDSWGLHATLFAGLTGESPFAGTTRETLIKNMFESEPQRLDDFFVDEPELQRILDRGLVRDSAKRSSVEELCEALEIWQRTRGKVLHSNPPALPSNAPPGHDEQSYIALSDPPAGGVEEEAPRSVAVPRPFGKSLVGIVMDEPIDADAPDYVPPRNPQDLLDAIDEDDDDVERIRAAQLRASKAPPPMPKSPTESARPAAIAARPPPRNASNSGRNWFFVAALTGVAIAGVALYVRYQEREAMRSTMIRASQPEGRLALCAESFFVPGTFDQQDSLAFICEAADLREATRQLSRRVQTVAERPGPTLGARWSELGWYELAATATVRRTCCPQPAATNFELPETPNSGCASPAATLRAMAETAAHGDLSKAGELQSTIECLHRVAATKDYGYERTPTDEQRRAFVRFVEGRGKQR